MFWASMVMGPGDGAFTDRCRVTQQVTAWNRKGRTLPDLLRSGPLRGPIGGQAPSILKVPAI